MGAQNTPEYAALNPAKDGQWRSLQLRGHSTPRKGYAASFLEVAVRMVIKIGVEASKEVSAHHEKD